jgi:hypothetical protein
MVWVSDGRSIDPWTYGQSPARLRSKVVLPLPDGAKSGPAEDRAYLNGSERMFERRTE